MTPAMLRCIIPCVWPVLMLITGAIWINTLKTRMLYLGTLPSDGPLDGFASKQDRVDFWDTTDGRTRQVMKALIVFGILFFVGTGVVYLITNFIFQGA